MPEYRLVFSNGKRSVRHVDIEAVDLASASRAFTPPVGWTLTSVRQTFGVAAGPSVSGLPSSGVGVGISALVAGYAIVTLVRHGAPASMMFTWILAIVAGLVGIPLLWMNHKAVQRELASLRSVGASAEWPQRTTRNLGWRQSLEIVLKVLVGCWALAMTMDPVSASGVIAGLCMGSVALSGVTRFAEGSSGVNTLGAKPKTV